MRKIIKNPMNLPDAEMYQFVNVFCNNEYEIVTMEPSAENLPESMIESYKDVKTHQKILADPQAFFSVYAIQYTDENGDEIIFPIGLFGVSENRKVRFPLLINGFWQAILMASKDSFSQFCNSNIDFYYSRFVELKRQFMTVVFGFYKKIDDECNSVMAWPSRGEKSNTRIVAEALQFSRYDDGKMDIYSADGISGSKLSHMSDCVLRWGILIDDRDQYQSNVIYPAERIQMLIRALVNFKEEAIQEELELASAEVSHQYE
jgi:hypothetical protein